VETGKASAGLSVVELFHHQVDLMTTLLLLLAIFAVDFLLVALALGAGAYVVNPSTGKVRRVVGALAGTTVIKLVAIAGAVGVFLMQFQLANEAWAIGVVALAVLFCEALVFSCSIRWIVPTTFWRATFVWVYGLIPSFFVLAAVLLIGRPFVLAAYTVPTNAMAPTVVGYHRTAPCPHCGQTLMVPVNPPNAPFDDAWLGDRPAICDHCFKIDTLKMDVGGEVEPPDRILVNKLLSPQRWDLIVFEYPEDPTRKYVSRLVGLPGEEVYIKDGAVWVNGVKLTPPEPLTGLQYVTELEFGMKTPMGSPERPWQLGPDEFCVLGDFTLRSSDSRYWGPVPRKNIEGVVALRY
jgi:signal peptidase I